MFNGMSTFPIFKSIISVNKFSSDFSVTSDALASSKENEMQSLTGLYYEVNV